MKNSIIVFALACLYSIQISFAQSSSSISISDDDDRFSVSIIVSQPLPKTIKAELLTNLGAQNSKVKSKELVWKDDINGELAYKIKIGQKECSFFLDKNVLPKKQFDQLVELSNNILELLEEDKNHGERATPAPPTPPSTPNRSRSADKKSRIKLYFDGDTNRQSTSVSVSNDDDEYNLRARFHTPISKKIHNKIERILGTKGTKTSYGKYIWEKNIDGERAYRFKLSKKTCKIFINKELFNETEVEELIDLANEIANYIPVD